MAMTVPELVAFDIESVEQNLRASENSKAARNYPLLAMNLGSAFNSALMVGLLQWRHSLADPKAYIGQALVIAKRAAEEIPEIDASQPCRRLFYFPAAIFVSYLLDRRSDPALENASYHFERRHELARSYCGPFLDTGVLTTLATGTRPMGWDDYGAAVAKQKRFALLRETSACYVEIIENATQGRVAEAATKVQEAAALFWKRARNSAYDSAGGGTDGGGPDNEHVVDFRLAALIRMCLPDQGASLTGDAAIHVWRWS